MNSKPFLWFMMIISIFLGIISLLSGNFWGFVVFVFIIFLCYRSLKKHKEMEIPKNITIE